MDTKLRWIKGLARVREREKITPMQKYLDFVAMKCLIPRSIFKKISGPESRKKQVLRGAMSA